MKLWIILLWTEIGVFLCLWLQKKKVILKLTLQTLSTPTDKDQLITRPCFQEREETGKTVALTDLNMHLFLFNQQRLALHQRLTAYTKLWYTTYSHVTGYLKCCKRDFSIHWGHMMSPTWTFDLLQKHQNSYLVESKCNISCLCKMTLFFYFLSDKWSIIEFATFPASLT